MDALLTGIMLTAIHGQPVTIQEAPASLEAIISYLHKDGRNLPCRPEIFDLGAGFKARLCYNGAGYTIFVAK